MENLNYCRQFMKWAKRHRFDKPGSILSRHIRQIRIGVKFVLPDEGDILGLPYEDTVALLDSEEKWNLPYEDIVLEYTMPRGRWVAKESKFELATTTKRIVLVHDLGDKYAISGLWYYDDFKEWGFCPWFAADKAVETAVYCIDDKLTRKVSAMGAMDEMVHDISGEMAILCRFLAALSCRNVGISHATSERKHSTKSALPYDSYRRLVITSNKGELGSYGELSGDRRSPREHLRRGHIRRLPAGNIWVQSTVVNLGVGGKVDKDYQLNKEQKSPRRGFPA